jgi:hypothetical protein
VVAIVVALASVLAALFAALQTFLKLGERSAQHRATAAEYGGIKREIDLLLVRYGSGEPVSHETLDDIQGRMTAVARDAPEMPERIWRAAKQRVPEQEPELLG